MAQQQETLRVIHNEEQEEIGLEFHPRAFTPTAIEKMVDNKVNTKEPTTIYMKSQKGDFFVNPARLREIRLLPLDAKREVIRQIAFDIAYSDNAIILPQMDNER